MNMEPMAGCPFGTPGNRRQNNGDTIRPKKPITPARSPIFISPSHMASIPVSPSDTSNANAAAENDPCIISAHTPASPSKTVRPSATANATRKNAAHM